MLGLGPAGTEPELEPPPGQVVDRRRHLGQHGRVPVGVPGHHQPDPHTRGRLGHRGQERHPLEHIPGGVGEDRGLKWSKAHRWSNPASSVMRQDGPQVLDRAVLGRQLEAEGGHSRSYRHHPAVGARVISRFVRGTGRHDDLFRGQNAVGRPGRQPGDPRSSQDHQHRLRGRPKPRLPPERGTHHDCDGDRHDERPEGYSSAPELATAQHGQDGERVEEPQARRGGPAWAPLRRVDLDHVPRAIEVPGPQDPDGGDEREPFPVVLEVAQRAPSCDVRLDGLVAARVLPEPAVGWPADQPYVGARKCFVAATAEKGDTVLGRDERGFLEAGEVVEEPRRDHEPSDADADAGSQRSTSPRARGSIGDGDEEQRDEQRKFRPGQRRQPAEHAEDDEPTPRGVRQNAVGREQGGGHQQDRRGLGHDEPVAHPQERIDGGDGGGGDARTLPGDRPSEQPDEDDRRRAEDGHGQPHGEDAVLADQCGRCQEKNGEGAVACRVVVGRVSAGRLSAGGPEPVAVNQELGLARVPERAS